MLQFLHHGEKMKIKHFAVVCSDTNWNSLTVLAEECFELGRYAYTQRDFYHTIKWMQEALDQDARELNKTADRALILDYLSYAMSMVRMNTTKLSFIYIYLYIHEILSQKGINALHSQFDFINLCSFCMNKDSLCYCSWPSLCSLHPSFSSSLTYTLRN